jgi:hypothetical protein
MFAGLQRHLESMALSACSSPLVTGSSRLCGSRALIDVIEAFVDLRRLSRVRGARVLANGPVATGTRAANHANVELAPRTSDPP